MDQIVLNHVTKQFTTKTLGTVTAVNDFNLTIKEGECFSFLGPSGCGKTTLTRILNGLCPGFYPGKLEGGYSLDGEDALKMPIHRLGTMVGSVFQDPRSQFFATNTTDEIVLGMENIPLERPVMQERLNTVCKQMNIERLIDRRIFPDAQTLVSDDTEQYDNQGQYGG